MIKKPMTATGLDLIPGTNPQLFDFSKVKFPFMVSAKFDGVRGVVLEEGKLRSRSFTAFNSKWVNANISDTKISGLDGELIYEDPTDPLVFNKTTSALATDGPAGIKLYAFDCFRNPFDPFIKRYELLQSIAPLNPNVELVPYFLVKNETEVYEKEKEFLDLGYEGMMGRSLYGQYKQGKATLLEGTLFKLKRFVDSEAVVLSFEEGLHNTNEAKKDNFGRTKRSSAKAGKVPNGTLGKMYVRDIHDGREFKITPPGSQEEVQFIWDNRPLFLGKTLKYKHQLVGAKNKPRIPIPLGWRLEIDL